MANGDARVEGVRLARDSFDAAVFDLDGVLTRTARVHAEAWKGVFDEFLRRRAAERGETVRPFDLPDDYLAWVDGRTRDEGARAFLESRGIRLPHGHPGDAPGLTTVWSISNRKRDRFVELLLSRGVEVDPAAAALVGDLRSAGLRTAVVSSSRNCRLVLQRAGLASLFDLVVDGTDRESLNLAGKPAPDTLLEAARRLEVDPARAVVFEDALVGVEAGRRAGFGCVVGMDRAGRRTALLAAGAHVTVTTLSQVALGDAPDALRPTATLPSALEEAGRLLPRTTGHRACVFLDYDGTLTPIVARPEDARLDELTRCVLSDLARRVPVTIVSGRDLRDVRALVAVDGLYYAGSHGFEIQAPDGRRIDAGPGDAFLPALDRAEADLRGEVEGIAGAQVDRKRFTVAVHYRNVREGEVPRVVAAVDAVAALHPELGRAEGKKVFELRPRIQWDKGHAVALLLKALGCDNPQGVPVYVGDDLTDEDAFRAVSATGLAIVVSDEPRPTCARYRLRDPSEVRAFLEALREVVAGEARS